MKNNILKTHQALQVFSRLLKKVYSIVLNNSSMKNQINKTDRSLPVNLKQLIDEYIKLVGDHNETVRMVDRRYDNDVSSMIIPISPMLSSLINKAS